MHDAFGVQTDVHLSGIVEVSGLSTRTNLKQSQHILIPWPERKKRRMAAMAGS